MSKKIKLCKVLQPLQITKDCWVYLNPRSIDVCVKFISEVKVIKLKLSTIEPFMR